jgi:hypothetical protein
MIRYIDEGDADQPFFGFLSLQAIHIPVQAPASSSTITTASSMPGGT